MKLVQLTQSAIQCLKHDKVCNLRANAEFLFIGIYVILISAYLAKQERFGSCYSLGQKGQKDKELWLSARLILLYSCYLFI
jgi:hypothetical protein